MASASDADEPPQNLTFSLDSGAPAGATVHPMTGAFTWTTTNVLAPHTNINALERHQVRGGVPGERERGADGGGRRARERVGSGPGDPTRAPAPHLRALRAQR